MPTSQTLAQFIHSKLFEATWMGITINEARNLVVCPKGDILKLQQNKYTLKFISFAGEPREYHEREKLSEIIFPSDFDIRPTLYFRRNGNFILSRETQFKKIINPLGKDINKIKIVEGDNIRKFNRGNLLLSRDTYTRAMADAQVVYDKKESYASSAENYLAKEASHKYSNEERGKTTYIEKGEFSFLINRFNLPTKKRSADYQKYLDATDITSLETFLDRLLKNEVFSEDFLRRLNDYFIKEKLRDIIVLGKMILELKSTDLETTAAKKVISKLAVEDISQLENLWQQYFVKYLLYLIFSYKKIFPKVELNNIDGDKKYPDFIGVNHYNGLDVIEIKTHLKNILVWDPSHKNFYFSPEMSKAIVQTTNYLDSIIQQRFTKTEDRTKITTFVEEENLYHPRGIIIISSDRKLTTKTGEPEKLNRDFTKLRNSLHNIEVLTFDEILNIADEYIKNIVEDPNV